MRPIFEFTENKNTHYFYDILLSNLSPLFVTIYNHILTMGVACHNKSGELSKSINDFVYFKRKTLLPL